MSTPAYVQNSSWVSAVAGVATIIAGTNSPSNITTGNAVLVAVTQNGSGAGRTYSIADGTNTYTSVKKIEVAARITEIFRCFNITGGALSIVITQAGGATGFQAQFIECTQANAVDTSDSFDDGSSVTAHNCAASGSIDTTTDVFVYCAGVFNAGPGTITAGAGYTVPTVGTNNMSQYKASAGALTDDRGVFTSGTARQGANVMVSVKAPAASGTGAVKLAGKGALPGFPLAGIGGLAG